MGSDLTVQADVVRFAPVAPQSRPVQAGAANLDGVSAMGLQVQGQLGLCECRHRLETAESESTNTRAHAILS